MSCIPTIRLLSLLSFHLVHRSCATANNKLSAGWHAVTFNFVNHARTLTKVAWLRRKLKSDCYCIKSKFYPKKVGIILYLSYTKIGVY